MQPPATVPEAQPSRFRGFLIGLVALMAALIGGQGIIELLGWPNNFLVMLGVFIVLDVVFMAVLRRVFGR